MKGQLAKMILCLTGVFVLLLGIVTLWAARRQTPMTPGEQLVLLNEIEQLTTGVDGANPAAGQFAMLREQVAQGTAGYQGGQMRGLAALYFGMTATYLLLVFFYVYAKILRPFQKLESYADRVAKGDLEFSLGYERTNFFGAFTWAFDHMREEILRARKCEAQAVEENKTIIATLSHDIKTPIASIRAYAEGLEAGLETDYEQRERYTAVIIKKCDEVTRLTNDLVLHSLSELERLEIKIRKTDIGTVLKETTEDLRDPLVHLCEPIPEAQLLVDEKRMAQVLENLLNNAKKYAPESEISVWAVDGADRYEIHVRDHGKGIPPEDMPFVLEKFYRGKNIGTAPGSGLGLYIVKYIMERQHGGIALENHSDGLEAVVWLPYQQSL